LPNVDFETLPYVDFVLGDFEAFDILINTFDVKVVFDLLSHLNG